MNRDWIPTATNAANQLREAAAAVRELYPRVPIMGSSTAKEVSVETVVSALEQFAECVRYLNTRRSSGAVIEINKEADVQDVVYLMLRPWVTDLVPENPTDRVASRFVIKDFLSKELATVVEAKYIRDKKHGHDISKEMHDDIEMYRNHLDCKHLVFFTYDRDAYIPDVAALKRQIEGVRTYSDKHLAVYCVIKP
jgi:hypothetical protein